MYISYITERRKEKKIMGFVIDFYSNFYPKQGSIFWISAQKSSNHHQKLKLMTLLVTAMHSNFHKCKWISWDNYIPGRECWLLICTKGRNSSAWSTAQCSSHGNRVGNPAPQSPRCPCTDHPNRRHRPLRTSARRSPQSGIFSVSSPWSLPPNRRSWSWAPSTQIASRSTARRRGGRRWSTRGRNCRSDRVGVARCRSWAQCSGWFDAGALPGTRQSCGHGEAMLQGRPPCWNFGVENFKMWIKYRGLENFK